MGANIATEVAAGTFCEATVGSRNYEHGQLVKGLIQTDEFRIVIKPDTEVIEVLGALKNIVAVAAGFSDGLGYGDNTKAAVIRLGLKEMVKFCEEFFPGLLLINFKWIEIILVLFLGHHPQIFLESCGVADLVTTCYGGRNRKVAAAFVKTGKDIKTLEEEMLNGQKLQGPDAAAEVQEWLKEKGQANK
jgi:glycerol-3-phosphate dehydrogenase (NAD+)